jgi:hypothetical protein
MFGPEDDIDQPIPPVDEFHVPNPLIQLYAQGFLSPQGERKLLLVNKRSHAIDITVPGAAGGTLQRVDESTTALPMKRAVASDTMHLPGLAVVVVRLSGNDAMSRKP